MCRVVVRGIAQIGEWNVLVVSVSRMTVRVIVTRWPNLDSAEHRAGGEKYTRKDLGLFEWSGLEINGSELKGIVINPGPDGFFNAVRRGYESMLNQDRKR